MCIYDMPQFRISCQHIQMYRVKRENFLLSIVASGNMRADFGY